jgi:hypothetical protein
VRLALKTPYRDGTTHVAFEPEDFIARLVALVPKPRAHRALPQTLSRSASPNQRLSVRAGQALDQGRAAFL